ncbi:MAG: transglutaminase domain-containing protein [Lachnospiraceae bacterium]|nr:transglutaminase domain-containing protein [Lachnospiraceae bacterium]
MRINDHFRYLNIGLPEDILRRKMHGDFKGAIRLIDRRLADDSTPQALRSCLIVQREIISRVEADYPYTKEEAIAIIREHIPDFEEAEFDERMDNGRIRWIYVDGEVRIFNRFFQSMVKADLPFAARAGVSLPGVESNVNKNVKGLIDRTIEKMVEKGSMTNRIRIRATMKVKDEVFEKGMFIRAHLPIPSACEQQSEIVIEKVYPENGQIAPVDAPQRAVCWEETMEENHEFVVEYSYLHKAVYHDTQNMGPSDAEQPDFYTHEEAPHIVFTPYIKELVKTLTEGVTDPLEKARIFYDFITLNMKYTFMPAYFGLENIAETCARTYTGDCGVFALLFITLCRCAGIPACWQSGLTAEPDFCGGHDWARFYVAPHGWLFADPSYGTGAVRLEKEERRKYYFGNLDPFRMVANSEFMAPFTVDKDHWRADPYDNQIGEMETTDRGLRYDEFIRDKVTLLCEEVE